nr:hypothetical protein [Tanacetum cinerariifolium]
MRNTKAYKVYYAYATGEATPKPKASARKKKGGSASSTTPPTLIATLTPTTTVVAAPRLSAAAIGKQPARATTHTELTDVERTEAEQLKIVLRRSRQEMHISQQRGSGTDEGTGSKPGVLDVPSDDSEEELSWNSSDDEDVDEQTKGKDESEGDKTDESDDDDDDQEEADKVNDDDDNEVEVPKTDEQETTESDEGDDEATESDKESEDEETREHEDESFDPIPRTPEESEDDDNNEEDPGIRIGEEERMNEEEEADELYRDHDALFVIDTEETLELAEESRLKMHAKQNEPIAKYKKVNIPPIDYAALNKMSEHFVKQFVPQKQFSMIQAFWLPISKPVFKTPPVQPEPVLKEIPHELPPISLVKDKKYLEIEKKKLIIKNDLHLKRIIFQDVMSVVMHADVKSKIVLPTNNNSLEIDNFEVELLKKENDRLLELIISQDNVHTARNTLPTIANHHNMEKSYLDEYNENLELQVELSKRNNMVKKAVYNELSKNVQGWKTELLVYVSATCPSSSKQSKKLIAVTPINNNIKVRFADASTSSSKTQKQVVQVILWYLDSGFSKHMTGQRSQLINFVSKLMGTVRFGNDLL